MAELKLDTTGTEQLGKDYYISVRVAEVQKLSRLNDHRTFKFPPSAVGSRRYGKVELFKRVGTGVVCIDPSMDQSTNHVNIEFEGRALNFDANVTCPEGCGSRQEKHDHENNPKISAAKEYLERHHLEVRLSEAMQAVLRERPDDPGEFMAKHLAGNTNITTCLPKMPGACERPPATAPAKQIDTSGLGDLPEFGSSSPAKTPASPAKTPASKTPKLNVPRSFGLNPSVGTWHSPRPVASTANKVPEPEKVKVGETLACSKSGSRGKVLQKKKTAVLLGKEDGTEEWKEVTELERQAEHVPNVLSPGDLVANVRLGTRGYVIRRTTADVLLKVGDQEEWHEIEELTKANEVPAEAKAGDEVRNIRTGDSGKVLYRTATEVLLKTPTGAQEWHGIEELETPKPQPTPKLVVPRSFGFNPSVGTWHSPRPVQLLPESVRVGETLACSETGTRGKVLKRKKTEVLLKTDDGGEEWKDVNTLERQAAAAAEAKPGELVANVKCGTRGEVISRTPTAALLKIGDVEEWHEVKELAKAGAVPMDLKVGDSAKNIRTGESGTVLKRTTTEVLIQTAARLEEWHDIEELERGGGGGGKIILPMSFRLGPTHSTFGLRHSVFLL